MNKVPRIKDSVKVRSETFGALIFTNRTPILALNQDSLSIWMRIDGNRSVGDIVALLRQSGVDVDASIVEEFFLSCEDLDLIELI